MPRAGDAGSAKGMRAKFGATLRKRHARVMGTLKAKRRCPSCGRRRFRRAAAGIWVCPSCGFKMAGGAYDAPQVVP